MRYMTTTKNLFDISKVKGTNELKVIGNSIYSYKYPAAKNDTNLLSIFKSLKPNINYTMSATTLNYLGDSTNEIVLAFSNANDYKIFYNYSAGFNKVTFSLTQEQINNITYVYFYGKPESNGGPTIWNNIQIEEGDTATPYVPYGYLPMYKGRYKVSDVCQLLDKSKYPATQTEYGITFTNNGDGSITVNGTCTNPYYSAYKIKENLDGIISGHKYAILGTGTNMSVSFMASYQGGYIWKVANNIFTLPENEYTGFSSQIRVTAGVSVSNITVKPQIFDLTEMYGAGNEPTTVEEFREKFPNELYPYSPYCWAKMKQMRYITTTKNLFNPLGREDANPTGNWPITKYDVGNVIYRGLAYTGYYQEDESYRCDVAVSGTVINVVQKINYYGVGYIVKCNPDTAYTLSFNTNFSTIVSIFLDLEGNKIGDENWNLTFTTPNNAYYLLVVFAGPTVGTYFIKNLQLELGDTATDYVPYGYLPLK